MIDLEEHYLDLVRAIVHRMAPQCEVRIFGSRVRGTARKYSDIDLAIVGSGRLPDHLISDLQQAFSESDLPYRVDVVDWHELSHDLQRIIREQGFEIIQKPDADTAPST